MPRSRAFVAATASLVTAFIASASPIPLYNTYRASAGITTADLSVTVAVYFLGTICSLLFLGRLSSYWGRRPASWVTLGLVLAGCLVLMRVDSLLPLLVGRFLMGVGAGMASSTLMAYVVDSTPERPAWVASVVTSQAPNLGLTVGALSSGLMVDHGPRPPVVVPAVMAGLLGVCLLLVWWAQETQPRRPGWMRSLHPVVHLPENARRLLPVSAWGFMATWAMGAAFQSFGPAIASEQLHSSRATSMALIFASYLLPSVFGAPLSGRFSPAAAQRWGMVCYLIGGAGLLVALSRGSLLLFLISGVLAGACQGVVVSGGIRGLLHGVAQHDRAAVLAAIYLTCYLGAMVPTLITGQLTRIWSLTQVMAGHVGLAVVATIVVAIGARNPRLAHNAPSTL